jgi:hypothetical protein
LITFPHLEQLDITLAYVDYVEQLDVDDVWQASKGFIPSLLYSWYIEFLSNSSKGEKLFGHSEPFSRHSQVMNQIRQRKILSHLPSVSLDDRRVESKSFSKSWGWVNNKILRKIKISFHFTLFTINKFCLRYMECRKEIVSPSSIL